MRLVFVALLTASLVSGCASAPASRVAAHELSLTSVERQVRGERGEVLAIENDGSFQDERIAVVWQPRPDRLSFRLTNRSAASLRVLWDDASFVGIDGTSDRVMHHGVKYADRSASQPPSAVARGATLDDAVVPTSKVYWQESLGTWQSRPLVEPREISSNDAQREVRVLLPVETEGTVIEYVFGFGVGERIEAEAGQDRIRIVRKREEVDGCHMLGAIEARPPYIWPGDDFRQLRRKAGELGADTVLVPGRRFGVVEGEAYRCAAQ